jgi:hypothetical protein
MSPVLEHLAGLVASVADGWPQDWDALEARAADDRTRRALKSLRVVAAIADSKRGLRRRASEGNLRRPAPRRPPREPVPPTTSGVASSC